MAGVTTTIDREMSRAKSALASSPIYDLRILHVDRDGDNLMISGRVKTFYHSQLAQEAVRAVVESSVVVINSIDVD